MGRMHALLSVHLRGWPDSGPLLTQGMIVPLPLGTNTEIPC